MHLRRLQPPGPQPGQAGRMVAKVEWHPGALFPRVGLDPLRGSSVTNLSLPAERVAAF